MTKRLWLIKLGVLAAAAAFTGVFFINWCDMVFQCGCTYSWAGAADHCNIHHASPPHCPWCANQTAAGASLGFTLLAQAAVVWWPGRFGVLRAAAAFVASPLAAGAAGVVVGLATGYWSL